MAKTKKQKNTEKNTVRNKTKSKVLSTQRYLQFAGVHDDTLILKNGGLRSVLEVGSVNFNLKSETEQEAIIVSYQRFLNALNFPVQILIKSRKLDIDRYLDSLRGKMHKQTNQLLKKQMAEYIEYVGKLVEYADIMEKKFFIVIPQNPLRAEKKSNWSKFLDKITPDDKAVDILQRRQEFKRLKHDLEERVNITTTGLENCGLQVTPLSTAQIIELFYQSYNPQLARTEKLEDMTQYHMDKEPV